MRKIAIHTVLYPFFAAVRKMSAALIAQRIERAVTKQAVKTVARECVAWKIFTVIIAEIPVAVLHNFTIQHITVGRIPLYPLLYLIYNAAPACYDVCMNIKGCVKSAIFSALLT